MSRFNGTLCAGLTVAVAVTLGGCGSNSANPAPPSEVARPASAPATSQSSVGASDVVALDKYRPADVAFFSKLRLEGAIVLRPPASLKTLSERSSVTLTASVTDVREAGMAGSTPVLEIVLKPQKVQHGKLHAPSALIRVSTLGLGEGTGAQQAASLRAALPQGQSLWFLRWQGDLGRSTKPNAPKSPVRTDPDLYALTHAFGVLVQGAAHVEAPLAEEDGPKVGFLREAERTRKVTDAIAASR